jgi:hypothetical protein
MRYFKPIPKTFVVKEFSFHPTPKNGRSFFTHNRPDGTKQMFMVSKVRHSLTDARIRPVDMVVWDPKYVLKCDDRVVEFHGMKDGWIVNHDNNYELSHDGIVFYVWCARHKPDHACLRGLADYIKLKSRGAPPAKRAHVAAPATGDDDDDDDDDDDSDADDVETSAAVAAVVHVETPITASTADVKTPTASTADVRTPTASTAATSTIVNVKTPTTSTAAAAVATPIIIKEAPVVVSVVRKSRPDAVKQYVLFMAESKID